MNITNAIQEIESIPFEIKYTVANSLKILLLAWEEDVIIQAMINMMHTQLENPHLILERINLLSKEKISLDTMHPHDMVIAIYLYILSKGESLGAATIAINIITRTKGFYWARKLAEFFLTQEESNYLTNNQYSVVQVAIKQPYSIVTTIVAA